MRPALQQAFGNLVSTANMLEFPSALALTLRESDGTDKSCIVANDEGSIINANGAPVEIHVIYADDDEYVTFRLVDLRILAAAGLTNYGTPFAPTSVTLDEYNSTQVGSLSTEWEW